MSARFLAILVHVFTASGLVFGFLSIIATIDKNISLAFLYLGITLVIDGIDGTLARAAKVKIYTPGVDGGALDFVIDYFTYVTIPAVMIWHWALVPAGFQTLAGALVLLAGSFTFAQVGMKAEDNSFIGFPALWNVVVFFVVLLSLSAWLSLFVIGAFLILTIVPTPYVHPFRTPLGGYEWLNWLNSALWTVSAAILGYQILHQGHNSSAAQPWFIVFIASSSYFAGISLFLTLKRIKIS